MGYVSESMVEAYETRENQYPPYGKEVVDVNGTKFMRDIKDETNKNKEQTFEAVSYTHLTLPTKA